MSVSHRMQKIRSGQSLTHQNHSTVKQIHRHLTPALAAGPVEAGEERPSTVFEAFQRKYNLDAGAPPWKRLFFDWIYLPFNRFCFFKLNLIPPDHLECGHCGRAKGKDGRLGWVEQQGAFSQQWRAEQEAAKYPFGGVEPVTFDTGEQDCTCKPRSIFPNSKARKRYEKNSHATVGVEVTALQKLANTIALSERCETSETT